MFPHSKYTRLLFIAAFGLFFFVFPAAAQNPPAIISQAAVVMDASTGSILYYKNPDVEIPPASLTKLMTAHLALREIAAGRASADEIINPPRESWAVNQPPFSSLMNLANGQSLSLKELLLGMAIFSGNDAATAVALRFAPSVPEFVGMMNREAVAMGLNRTRFADASGYSMYNMTTAREFAQFCRIYLAAYPDSLEQYHSVMEFAYPSAENLPEIFHGNPRTRVQRNRNNLLGNVEGVDGLKTGFIFASGFNIALTAERNGSRFIAVLLGAPSGRGGDRIRDEDGRRLLEWAFERYKTIRPRLEIPESVRVWKGRTNHVDLVLGEPLAFTTLTERGNNLDWHLEIEGPLMAPISAGSHVGNIVFYDDLGVLRRLPMLAASDVRRGGPLKRFFHSFGLLFRS
ncbi:MAG: D-alanyl-D-alanine carboxypeptidase [Treponema sp.]|nr:D-alanyl-D-alanine carboxypeptidase [Treponema sp.]